MGDYKYLINVSNKNNNKFYEMIEESNGTFTVNYGRVDVTKISTMKNWNLQRDMKISQNLEVKNNQLLKQRTVMVIQSYHTIVT